MGVLFLEHLGGEVQYHCKKCKTYITRLEYRVRDKILGDYGIAALFSKVVNVIKTDRVEWWTRNGIQCGYHLPCKKCKVDLGMLYDFVKNEDERYKEGNYLIEMTCLDVVKMNVA